MKKPKPIDARRAKRRVAARRSRIDPCAPRCAAEYDAGCRRQRRRTRARRHGRRCVHRQRIGADEPRVVRRRRGRGAPPESQIGLADDTIKALLGDEWRAQARKILSDARSTVEGAGARLVGGPDERAERIVEGAHRPHARRLAGRNDEQPHRRSAHAAARDPRKRTHPIYPRTHRQRATWKVVSTRTPSNNRCIASGNRPAISNRAATASRTAS